VQRSFSQSETTLANADMLSLNIARSSRVMVPIELVEVLLFLVSGVEVRI